MWMSTRDQSHVQAESTNMNDHASDKKGQHDEKGRRRTRSLVESLSCEQIRKSRKTDDAMTSSSNMPTPRIPRPANAQRETTRLTPGTSPEITNNAPDIRPRVDSSTEDGLAFGLNFQPTPFTQANVVTKLRAVEKENFRLRGRLDEKESRERRLTRKFGPNSAIPHVETNRTKALSTPNLQELVFQERTERPTVNLESGQKLPGPPHSEKDVRENLEVSKTSDLGDSMVEKQNTTVSNLTKEIGNLQEHLKKSGELNDQYRLQATIMRSKIAELEESNNDKDVQLFTRNLELSECRALNLELKQKLQKLSEDIGELKKGEGVKRSFEGVEIKTPENRSVDSTSVQKRSMESGVSGKENMEGAVKVEAETEGDAEYMAGPTCTRRDNLPFVTARLPMIEGVSPIKRQSSATPNTRRAC